MAVLTKITQRSLADNAVSSSHIQADVVTTTDIATGGVGTTELADDAVTSPKLGDNLTLQGSYVKMPSLTTTQRDALTPAVSMIIFNSTLGMLQQYGTNGWLSIDAPPVFTSVSPTTVDETSESVVITGSNFSNPITSVKFKGADGTLYTPASTTRNSSTQITVTPPATGLPVSNEPFAVTVTNSSGLVATGGVIDAGGVPTFTAHINGFGTTPTANGKDSSASPPLAASIANAATGTHHTFAAVDPDGKAVTYTTVGSVWSGRNLTLSSAGVLSGNPTDSGTTTAFTETVRATDASANYTDQQFQIKVGPPTFRAGDGSDGALTQGSGLKQNCNTYYIITGNVSAAATPNIPLNTVSGLAVGDKVLIWQTQNTTTTADIGKMLYATITAVNSPNITIAETLSWNILSGTSAGTHYNAATCKNAQLIRIPQYTTVTVNSGGVLAPPAWNGQTGGIFIMEVLGTCTVNSGGFITASACGFRGGAGGNGINSNAHSYDGRAGECGTGGGLLYSPSTQSGGTPHYAPATTYFPHGVALGHNDVKTERGDGTGDKLGWGAGSYDHQNKYSGGGGAGGGKTTDGTTNTHYTNIAGERFVLGCGSGGGGGASQGNNSGHTAGGAGGGSGAGVIIIRANTVANSGKIEAKLGYGGGGLASFSSGASAHSTAGRGSNKQYSGGTPHNLCTGNGESHISLASHTASNGHGSAGADTNSHGGSGTGTGGKYAIGTAGAADHGGMGGWTGLTGGGNGGRAVASSNDGGGGGGAGGHGGGGAGSGLDIGAGGAGGQGGSGGVIYIETGSLTVNQNIKAPRGLGGGGAGGCSGGSGSATGGGAAQWAMAMSGYPASNAAYSSGGNTNTTYYGGGPNPTGYSHTSYFGSAGGGGTAGYIGEEGHIVLRTTAAGSYSGSLSTSTVDNAQAETGGDITTGTFGTSSTFGANGSVGY